MRPTLPEEVVQILEDASRCPDDTCFDWPGKVSPQGYGRVGGAGAHRVSYWYHSKKDPGELHIMHKCDNRLCINPSHLKAGTHSDNMRDRWNKYCKSPLIDCPCCRQKGPAGCEGVCGRCYQRRRWRRTRADVPLRLKGGSKKRFFVSDRWGRRLVRREDLYLP